MTVHHQQLHFSGSSLLPIGGLSLFAREAAQLAQTTLVSSAAGLRHRRRCVEATRESVGVCTRHSFSTPLVCSVAQACCSVEATLRDEKALHAVTRQELGRVLDRLKFYTGSRIASSSSSSAALKDYRALRNTANTSQKPCPGSAQWNRTFRKNRAGVKVCESKCQHVISIQQTRGTHNSDIGVQVNLLTRAIDDRPKLSTKMRYGIAAVFQDKSSCKTLPANAGRGTRISKPLRGVITEREAALGILSREVKLLQEERDHLQELLQHSLQGVVPQHAAHVSKGLQQQIEALKAENQRLLDSYNAERVMRKKYYNMVEDMKGKIRVYCRVKPLTSDQQNKDLQGVIDATDDYTLVVHAPRGDKEFTFDRVFMPHHTQEDVFGETNSLVQSAMDGYNVCIFAYGQTGSGKTYTLTGVSNTEQLQAEGIAPRAFRRMFELVKENEMKQSFLVTATFVELYNERFVDLLKANSNPEEKLEVRKDSSGHTFVPGVTTEEVSNSAQLCECFARALKNRRVACTRMNAQSSRSHFVATVEVTSTNRLNGAVLRGKLSLVDLAGSERLDKSGLEGDHIKETNSINKSLSALGDVIQALVTQQSHVPYRNNKLTMLMQDSLGGTAKTLMFVNVSPSGEHVEETVNSLVYATRVRQITNDIVRASETKEIAKLKSVIAKLKKEIAP
nr:kinesin-like protein KIN-14I [Rhipicephalus microplus]